MAKKITDFSYNIIITGIKSTGKWLRFYINDGVFGVDDAVDYKIRYIDPDERRRPKEELGAV